MCRSCRGWASHPRAAAASLAPIRDILEITEVQRDRLAILGREWSSVERKPTGLVWFVAGHVVVTAWTWRDIQRQPPQHPDSQHRATVTPVSARNVGIATD